MNGNDIELYSALFCSLLMLHKVLSNAKLRDLIQNKKVESLADIYLYQDKFLNIDQLTADQYEAWKKFRKSEPYQRLDEYVTYTKNHGIHSLDYTQEQYPPYLKVFPNMPVILYYKGDPGLLDKKCSRVSIVGTRRPSSYGRRVTREYAKVLSLHDIVIVSGLARGIDGIAHMTCLENAGKTIAVLPCGLDFVYPPEHESLSRNIAKNGLLLSELAPGTKPVRKYFPSRNRILSAISDCVLIAEAGSNSGTLHTAAFAAAQGKEVFTVPSVIYSDTAKGNLSLLKDGASVTTEPEDILAYLANVVFFREIDEIKESYVRKALDEKIKNHPEDLSSSEVEYVISDLLVSSELSTDEIVKLSGIPYITIVSALGKMEVEGKVIKERQKYILTIRKY